MNELAMMQLAYLRSVGACWGRGRNTLTLEQSISLIRHNTRCTASEAVAELYGEYCALYGVGDTWASK